VLKATEKDRQTCLCVKHKNLQYQVDKLKGLGLKYPQQISIPLLQRYVVTPRAKLVCIENVRSVNTNKLLHVYQMGILENRSHEKKWVSRRVEKVKRVQGEDVKYVTSLTMQED
jgi:hypothetical protein